MNIGVKVYKNIVISNNENFELRTSLSYVATKIRQTDTKDLTFVEEKEGVPILVLGEKIDENIYQTLIYYYNGHLCELYLAQGMDYELDYGMEVMEIEDFSFQIEDGRVQLSAKNKAGDKETLSLSLRAGR